MEDTMYPKAWNEMHPDYKIEREDGTRAVLVLRPEGTTLWPVTVGDEPTTVCRACGVGPFFFVPGRGPAADLCLDHADTLGLCRACGLRDATPGRADGLCSECYADAA